MPHIEIKVRAVAAIMPLVVSLACFGMTACGSSSSGSSTSPQTGNTAAKTAVGTTAASASSSSTTTENAAIATRRRRLALRLASCLHGNGVKVPEPSSQGYISISGSIAGTRRYKAAMAKCGYLLDDASKITSGGK